MTLPTFDELRSRIQYVQVDICGLVKKMQSKKRKGFRISRDVTQLSALIGSPPQPTECFKMLSVGGGFSSLGIIKYIAELEGIQELYASTFRIGKSHFEVLNSLHGAGKLDKAHFITSSTQERTDDKMVYKGREYNYYEYIVTTCEANGWEIKSFDNHSKLILMKTPTSFYVVETSSNLNENPKMEQFSWENDESLYRWYKELFVELLRAEGVKKWRMTT